ncbi:MAG: OmpA family protein [Nitrospirae bacterium]|nr:OmpA family protein [Nitrospirota bacterium]
MTRSLITRLSALAMSPLLAILLLPPPAIPAPPDPTGLRSVTRGEAALTFSSGFIRHSLPLEGVVSQITGDSQTTGNKLLLGKGDVTYLHMARPEDVTPGDLYTLYRRVHEVFHPTQGSYLGNLFIMVGIVQVTQIDGRLATVRILHSYGPITSGDGAMRFVPPPPTEPAPAERALATMTGMIIDLPPQQFLIGQSNIVYLDRGRHDGLQAGDRLDIFRLGGGLPMRLIGEVKVLALEETTATVLVVRSTAPVLRGDRVILKETPEQAAAKKATPETLTEELDRLAGTRASRPAPEGLEAVHARGGSLEEQLTLLARKLEFEPGEAPVKPAGLPILKQIGDLLKTVTEARIIIAGHTDNRPIGPTLQRQLPSNQVLSEARASSVARFLLEESGVDRTNVSAVGYADTRPIASNATEEGRRKNRRIEITLERKDRAPRLPSETPLPTAAPRQQAPIPPAQEALPPVAPPDQPQVPAEEPLVPAKEPIAPAEEPVEAIPNSPNEPPLETPPAEEPPTIPQP